MLGAMTLPFGRQSNKLVLFHRVKMYHSLTRQKLCTAHRTYWLHLLSTLGFKEFAERRELQEEVRDEGVNLVARVFKLIAQYPSRILNL